MGLDPFPSPTELRAMARRRGVARSEMRAKALAILHEAEQERIAIVQAAADREAAFSAPIRPRKARSPRQLSRMQEESITSQPDGSIACYLHEPPSANRWWRNVSGRMVLSREAREYKARVALFASFGGARPILRGTNVQVKLIWWRGRKSGDLDKRLGVLLDALQGVAYENDSQITSIVAERFDSPNAHAVIVHVTPLAEVEG